MNNIKSVTYRLFGPDGIPDFNIPNTDEFTQIKYGGDVNLYFTFLCVDFGCFENFLERDDIYREATILSWLESAQKFEKKESSLGNGLFATLIVTWLATCALEGKVVLDNSLKSLIALSKKHYDAGGESGFVYFFEAMSNYMIADDYI